MREGTIVEILGTGLDIWNWRVVGNEGDGDTCV